MNALTNKDYWDRSYVSREHCVDWQLGWRDYANHLLVKTLESIGLDGKSVLEIGAGDSQWLPYLARKYPSSRFAGLDYSQSGCERLAKRVVAMGEPAAIQIYHQDMFATDSALHGSFDLVLSFGVVEHFTELSHVLLAKRQYLKKDGVMFSVIPNMAGVLGHLTKLFNRAIYDLHNPHDWLSFLEGHRRAGLTVVSGGYLGSTSFGVLSSCFQEQEGLSWHTYVWLTRVSKAIWFLESKFGDLPVSRMWSPYIVAISRAN